MTMAMETPAPSRHVDRAERAEAAGAAAGRGRRTWWRLAQCALVIWIAALAVVAGVELRRAVFVATVDVRFEGDIHNAFRQGSEVYAAAQREVAVDAAPSLGQVVRAYLQRYDVVAQRGEGRYGLDYPPARLLVMSLWAYHVRTQRPDAQSWSDADLFPLLTFNTWIVGLGCVAVFLLVRHWRARGCTATEVTAPLEEERARPLWVPLGCALLLWFNLAVLVNAHMWPQWDVWPVAFYLWAVYFGSRGWWFTAGATIALGCMFKGQLLIVTPVLILWPLLRGQLGAVVRQLVGFGFAMAVMTSMWVYGGPIHGWWLTGLALVGLAVAVLRHLGRSGRRLTLRHPAVTWGLIGFGVMAITALVLMAWWVSEAPVDLTWGVLLVLVMLLPMVFVRQVPLGVWAAGVFTAAMFLGGLMFGGSFNWLEVGFVHGSDQYQGMYIGHAYNLASLMQDSYGWRLQHQVEWLGGIEVKAALKYLFAALSALVGLAAAVQSRRMSPRMLLVLTAPWLLMFAVLAQMHERYLLYAAAVSAIAAGYSCGFMLLHLFISAVASALMWRQQRGNAEYWPELHRLIIGFTPGMAWAVLLASLIVLYASLAVGDRRRRGGAIVAAAPHGAT